MVDSELPADFDTLHLPFVASAIDLLGQLGLGGNAPLRALAGEGREVQLDLVEPGAALGRIVDLEAGGWLFGHRRGQAVVEGTQGVAVTIILPEADFLGLGVAGGQLLPKLGVLALGAPASDLVQALAGQGLDGSQHAAGAVFGIGVVLLGRLPRLARLTRLRGLLP